jgi:hypothetical protein
MLVNNITSAFTHNGVPVANGFLEVYMDRTSTVHANLTVGGFPAENPVRLNSNGGIGAPVEVGLSSAYCIVKNAKEAVLFGYDLADTGTGAGFPNDGKLTIMQSGEHKGEFTANQADDAAIDLEAGFFTKKFAGKALLIEKPGNYIVMVRNYGCSAGSFFVMFYDSGDYSSDYGAAFRVIGAGGYAIAEYPVICFQVRDGRLYMVLDGYSTETCIYWNSPNLKGVSVPEGEPDRRYEMLRFNLPPFNESNNPPSLPYPAAVGVGVGVWEPDSTRCYIEGGAKLIMKNYGEMRLAEGFQFDMRKFVSFSMHNGSSIFLSTYSKLIINDRASVEAHRNGAMLLDNGRVEVRDYGMLKADSMGQVNVRNSGTLFADNYAHLGLYDYAAIHMTNYSHLNVGSGNMNPAWASGLDVVDNSDVYIGRSANNGGTIQRTKSERKLWMLDGSFLFMCNKFEIGNMNELSESIARYLIVADGAKVEFSGGADVKVADGAKVELRHSCRIRGYENANMLLFSRISEGGFNYRGKVVMLGDACLDIPDWEPIGHAPEVVKEDFLGEEYKLVNATDHALDVAYTNTAGGSDVLQIPPGKYKKMLLLGFSGDTPMFAGEA